MNIPLLKFANRHRPECFKFDSPDINCYVTRFDVLLHDQINGNLHYKPSLRVLLDLNQLITLQNAFIDEMRQIKAHVGVKLRHEQQVLFLLYNFLDDYFRISGVYIR